jgi:hypothetical protein
LTVSWWQAHRNVRLASNAIEVQVVADIFRDVRSPEFRANLDAILRRPPPGDLERGFESLDESSRESAYAVSYFFEDLGVLVSNGLIRRDLILTTVSSILTRAWHALGPAIDAERAFRRHNYAGEVSPTFLPHFEALVTLAIARQSPSGRGRLPGQSQGPSVGSVHAENRPVE